MDKRFEDLPTWARAYLAGLLHDRDLAIMDLHIALDKWAERENALRELLREIGVNPGKFEDDPSAEAELWRGMKERHKL